MYPIEHFAADAGGAALFALVERGAVRLINPPSALLLQNKAAMAIIWELAQSTPWFGDDDRKTIERVFLPTYLDPPIDAETYVRKPVLGREGNSVAIVRGGDVVATSHGLTYARQPVVYQQYVDLPRIGNDYAIVTCFVVDGEPSAVAVRAGAQITDARAHFLPISLRDAL